MTEEAAESRRSHTALWLSCYWGLDWEGLGLTGALGTDHKCSIGIEELKGGRWEYHIK